MMAHPLTKPAPPPAWLLLLRGQDSWLVHGVYDAPDHPDLLREHSSCLEHGNEMRIVRDDPSLDVLHRGLWISTPAWLNARDNWFLRYQSRLAPYLVAPRIAQVFTFATGKLLDPLCTFKAKPGGPCPLPRGTAWPTCGYCNSPMVMVGVLDFRQFTEIKVPSGSLVLHGCPECALCADPETWSVNWLIAGEPLDIHGDLSREVEIGTRWWAAEYPTPKSAVLDRLFERSATSHYERATWVNFSCAAEKVGGHVHWIQGDDEFADQLSDGSLVYIGKMTGEDESLRCWDTPVVYLLYSPTTGKTIASLQSF